VAVGQVDAVARTAARNGSVGSDGRIPVGVGVGDPVGLDVGVEVPVGVDVGVEVGDAVDVGLVVVVGVAVCVGVAVAVPVGVPDRVEVGVGEAGVGHGLPELDGEVVAVAVPVAVVEEVVVDVAVEDALAASRSARPPPPGVFAAKAIGTATASTTRKPPTIPMACLTRCLS
jgi:hypothetical protein